MARCEKLQLEKAEVVQLASFFAEDSQFVGLELGISYEDFVANTRPRAVLAVLKARLAEIKSRPR
jgi:hypothetical protein